MIDAQDVPKRRIKLELGYDGGDFHGWQVQQDLPTVQGCIESALERLLRHPVNLLGSGRTDAGVHAIKQVATFSTMRDYPPSTICRALNALLPSTIRIWEAIEVPWDFHPIRDILGKRYRYLIDDSRPALPFLRRYAWQYPKRLDVAAMRESLACLQGTHDFAAFQTTGSPRETTIRTVTDVSLERSPQLGPWQSQADRSLIVLEIEADGFLYNMVRAIAGTLCLIGETPPKSKTAPRAAFAGRPDRMREILQSLDRAQAGPTAPPHGLYMLDVTYPS